MLTKEQNDLLTRTGPGTPGGELLRRYWQPAALSAELAGGAPIPIQLLGEELVMIRDEEGRPGLLGLHCSHRAADLSYGRLEDGGLRCLYHGWLYDVHGNCLEQPGEPAGSDFKSKIHHPAYPCQEMAGIIFAYLGPGEPPVLPAYEFLTIGDEHRWVSKYHHECNYLQGNEGNIDPQHLSFLHRFLREDELQNADATTMTSGATSNALFGRDLAPTIEVEETDYGQRIYTVRDAGEGQNYVRISNFILPNLSAFPGATGGDGYQINWHVPIDDTHNWKYTVAFKRSAPINREWLDNGFQNETDGAYRIKRDKSNRYLQDRDQMKVWTYIGMGMDFQAHDKWATEGEGPIEDRTGEHLGTTDRAIAAARQQLLRAIRDVREGVEAPHVIRDPRANDVSHIVVKDETVPASTDWHTYWRAGQPAGVGQ